MKTSIFLMMLLVPLVAGAQQTYTITATWDPNPEGENVTEYGVQWEHGGDSGEWSATTSVQASAQLQAELTALPADGTQYRARVNAVNAAGNSDWSYSQWVTVGSEPPGGQPPTAPGGFTITLTVSQ